MSGGGSSDVGGVDGLTRHTGRDRMRGGDPGGVGEGRITACESHTMQTAMGAALLRRLEGSLLVSWQSVNTDCQVLGSRAAALGMSPVNSW